MTPTADLVIAEGFDMLVEAKGERDEARFPLLFKGLESIDSPAREERASALERKAGAHVAGVELADWREYLAGLNRAQHKRAVKLLMLSLDHRHGRDADAKAADLRTIAGIE